MNCRGCFVFRDFRKVDAGEFTNDNGEVIKYDESYKLKVDEATDSGVKERVFKVATDNTNVINAIMNVEPYEKIYIDFLVKVYNTRATLTPLAVELA